MPQKKYEFQNVDEAINILSNYASGFNFPLKKLSRETIIRISVLSNVFRAFKNLDQKPSQIYRDWATDNFDLILADFKNVESTDDYYEFVFKYSDSLIKRWAEKVLNPNDYLIYGPALKMVNLFIKTSQQSFDYRQLDKLEYQQVPFDSFSLQPLRLIINDLAGLKYKIAIPTNASMGFINTPQIYRIIMDAVYKLCKDAKIPPIIYDYWSWEDKHTNH